MALDKSIGAMPHARIAGRRTHWTLTAYHEAAHAVVALLYGIRVIEACVAPDRLGSGWMLHERPGIWATWVPEDRAAAWRMWTQTQIGIERYVKVLLAGPLAVAKVQGTPLRCLGARSDLAKAIEIEAYLAERRKEFQIVAVVPDLPDHFLDRMRRQTRRLIAQPWCWKAITAVADDLRAWHRLSGDEVAETVQWSKRTRGQMSLGLSPPGQTENRARR